MPFEPIHGSRPLTLLSAVAPPFVYFLALSLLPPSPKSSLTTRRLVGLTRSGLAVLAATLFARLPLRYHVPWSAGLTYILSLTGWYGCARVVDVFFISRHHIPRRVHRKLKPFTESAVDTESDTDTEVVKQLPAKHALDVDRPGGNKCTKRKSLLAKFEQEGAVTIADFTAAVVDNMPTSRIRHGSITIEKAVTEKIDALGLGSWRKRFLYAIDLETSMRGVGWSWTTADVRHTKHTWLPTLHDEIDQLVCGDIPTVAFAFFIERYVYRASDPAIGIDSLNAIQRGLLTLSLGIFLFGTFSAGYTSGAILTAPLRTRYREWTTHNLAFWPPLNSQPMIKAVTVRQFWSRSWHRLFSRLFLVYGVWPGQYLERLLLPAGVRKQFDPQSDVGKVAGAFFISGIVHAAAGISINGGRPSQTFEWLFFWCNGVAIIMEEGVKKVVIRLRGDSELRWYDAWVGRFWTATILLWSGQYFTRGWYDSGLVEEMVTLPIKAVQFVLDRI